MHFLAIRSSPYRAIRRGAAFHRGTRRGHRQASAPGVIPACGGGSHRGSRAPGIAARGYRAEHARCARRLRRWAKMRAEARRASDDLGALSARFDARDVSEAQALLSWMENATSPSWATRNTGCAAARPGRARAGGGNGARRAADRASAPASTTRTLPSDIRRQSRARDLVLVTKANLQSSVHRAGYLDYVGVKSFDAAGRLIGERRFLGLWTSSAYNCTPREIPLVRHKVAQVVQHFALAPTATTARRCSTYWSHSRGTRCSRPACPT